MAMNITIIAIEGPTKAKNVFGCIYINYKEMVWGYSAKKKRTKLH